MVDEGFSGSRTNSEITHCQSEEEGEKRERRDILIGEKGVDHSDLAISTICTHKTTPTGCVHIAFKSLGSNEEARHLAKLEAVGFTPEDD